MAWLRHFPSLRDQRTAECHLLCPSRRTPVVRWKRLLRTFGVLSAVATDVSWVKPSMRLTGRALRRQLKHVPLLLDDMLQPVRAVHKAPRGALATMVNDMVSSISSLHAILWRAMLSFFFLDQLEAGFLVKSMRLIPTNMVGRPANESDCCGSHVKRASTISVIVYEVQGEVLSGGEGHDVGRLVRTDVAKYTMSVGEPRHDAP